MAHKFVLWESTNCHARRGRKTITYVDNLKEDSGLDNDMRTHMLDREVCEIRQRKAGSLT